MLAALSGSCRDWGGPRAPHFLGAVSLSLQRAPGAFAGQEKLPGLSRRRPVLPSPGCQPGALPKDKGCS